MYLNSLNKVIFEVHIIMLLKAAITTLLYIYLFSQFQQLIFVVFREDLKHPVKPSFSKKL